MKRRVSSTIAIACLLGSAGLVEAQSPEDEKKAMDQAEAACAKGKAEPCLLLAAGYATGKGGRALDATKAADLAQKGCDSKLGKGCLMVAAAFQDGKGRAKDAAKAKAMFEKGADPISDLFSST